MTILLCFTFLLVIIGTLLLKSIKTVYAHCDTMDGPVVSAAKRALTNNDVNLALIWVGSEYEQAVAEAFDTAVTKRRTATDEATRGEADYKFFEELVKAHREGEGVLYDGLKPASASEEERLADEAVETGNLDEVLSRISSESNKEIVRHLFHHVQEKAGYLPADLEAGREYIAAYTKFIHAVEPAIHGEDLGSHAGHHH